jgi:hypothetical protein
MTNHEIQLEKLLRLINRFDAFGDQSRSMSLFSVAIGTLRKDRSIASDILTLTTSLSTGLGALALSRILIEDYLHLRLLDSDPAELPQRLDDFNNHPHIDHYWTIQAMREWGFDFSDNDEVKATMASVEKAFARHKDRFLRKGHGKEPFKADDYYRTWTGLTLNDLITKSGLPTEDGDKKALKFMTETYDAGSTVIHHNAFIIWFLASQGFDMFSANYPELAVEVSFIVLNGLMNLMLKIARNEPRAGEKYLAEQLELESIMSADPPALPVRSSSR